jgi:hypothetical protein
VVTRAGSIVRSVLNYRKNVCGARNCVFAGGFAKNGCFCDGFLWCFCGEFVVFLWWMKTRFLASKKNTNFSKYFSL